MVAITPYLELKRSERGKVDSIEDVIIYEEDLADMGWTSGLAGLSAGEEKRPRTALDADGQPLDPLAKPHTELTRLLWARTLIANSLVGAKFQLEFDADVLYVKVVPPATRSTIPWSFASNPLNRFALFSTNSKMDVPTFDLPAGMGTLGGACPGAAFAQSTVTELETSTAVHGELVMSPRFIAQTKHLIEEVQKDWAHDEGTKKGIPKAQRGPPLLNLNTTTCTRCIAGATLVMVRGEGLQRIEDLVGRKSFEVWSGIAWRTTHAVMNKLDRTVEVQFAGGRKLRCTPDHGIITTDGEVQAQHLVAGEHQINPVLPSGPSFPPEAALPSCILGEQHHNEKRGELPTQWSRELGVWLGYLMGNGWFSEQAVYPTIGVCASVEDIDDLERLATITAPWAGGRPEVGIAVVLPNDGLVPAEGSASRVYWRLKGMVALVRSLGFSKKGEISTPAAVWSASEAGVAGYLSGLFSTDGSVARWPKRVAVSFANTSRRLCEEVQQLLFAFGIRSNICEYTSNAKRGYKSMWKVDVVAAESVQRFAQYIGFFNARKSVSLQNGLLEMGEVKSQVKRIDVTAVVPGHDLEPVYDLINVGDEHQFIANGIPVSNCYASGGKYGEAVVQFSEVARYAMVRAMLATPGGEQVLVKLLVQALESLKENKGVDARHGIRPIRVHSSGDFFSIQYAKMWLKVARQLEQNAKSAAAAGDTSYKPFVLWAPTRTHVLKHWADFWRSEQIPLNFIIRPSAYSVGDPAPFIGRLSPTGSAGTSVLFADDTRKRLELKRGVDPRTGKQYAKPAEYGDGTKFDFQCGVYALAKGEKTCIGSIAPDGKVGCRACWLRPDMAIDYVIH